MISLNHSAVAGSHTIFVVPFALLAAVAIVSWIYGASLNSKLTKILYRVFFHPLSNIPGPFVAKVSDIWISWETLRTRRAQTLAALHRKYGSVVRVAPNEISFSDPAVYRDIYGKNKYIKKDIKFYGPLTLRTPNSNNIFSICNIAQHASRRRLESRAFAQSSIMEIVDKIVSKAMQLTNALQKLGNENETADVYAWFHMFAFEVICRRNPLHL